MPFVNPQNTEEFKTEIVSAGDKLAFCQISTSWCGPCQGIKQDMAALAEEFDAKYKFVYVDCDLCEEIQETFEVTSMPTFLVFKGMGAPLARYEGALVPKIREFIEANQDK